MSHTVGSGLDAVLIAGGMDSPESVGRSDAARELLRSVWLYGMPHSFWDAIYGALAALHPDAAEHFKDSGEAKETLDAFWPEED